MIAVDTSALMAILLNEPESDSLISVLETEPELMMSSVTVAEALIVAGRRGIGDEMARLIEDLALTIVPVTGAVARRAAEAYSAWGKGQYP